MVVDGYDDDGGGFCHSDTIYVAMIYGALESSEICRVSALHMW